jgi:hypothetical protein
MKLTFYGRRGAVPVCEADFQELGGNTTCVHLAFPDTQTIAILDAGTELKNLGRDLLATGHRQKQRNLLRFFLNLQLCPAIFAVNRIGIMTFGAAFRAGLGA